MGMGEAVTFPVSNLCNTPVDCLPLFGVSGLYGGGGEGIASVGSSSQH